MAQIWQHLDPKLADNDSLAPLNEETAADGKSLVNPKREKLSSWYDEASELFRKDKNHFE